MVHITDAGAPLADYRFTPAGYDATGQRFIDFSGNGYHLPLNGVPVLSDAHGGVSGWRMHGDIYAALPWFLGSHFTALEVSHSDLATGQQIEWLWGRARVLADNNDPAAEAPVGTWDSSWNKALRAVTTDTQKTFGDEYWVKHPKAYTPAQWNVTVNVMDVPVRQRRIAINNLNFTESHSNYGPGQDPFGAMVPAEDLRIGYREGGALTTAGGKHNTVRRIVVWPGSADVDKPAGLAGIVSALFASPGAAI